MSRCFHHGAVITINRLIRYDNPTDEVALRVHLLAHGGGTTGVAQIKRENHGFSGSGWHRAALETIPNGGGLRPPPFGMVSRPPGAAQTPKMTDFRVLKKS